mgnify:CR=1 FL=1
MSEIPEKPIPDDVKPSPVDITIQITKASGGGLGLQILGQSVKLVDCRKLLEWALNRVNDEITTEIVKGLFEEKAKANGFRKFSLKGLLTR